MYAYHYVWPAAIPHLAHVMFQSLQLSPPGPLTPLASVFVCSHAMATPQAQV